MSYNIADLFERVAGAVPDRVAVHAPARSLTYAELDDRANRLANHLRAAGIGRGDAIGLQLLNGTEYLGGIARQALGDPGQRELPLRRSGVRRR